MQIKKKVILFLVTKGRNLYNLHFTPTDTHKDTKLKKRKNQTMQNDCRCKKRKAEFWTPVEKCEVNLFFLLTQYQAKYFTELVSPEAHQGMPAKHFKNNVIHVVDRMERVKKNIIPGFLVPRGAFHGRKSAFICFRVTWREQHLQKKMKNSEVKKKESYV